MPAGDRQRQTTRVMKCAETTMKRVTAAVWGAVAAAVDVLKVQ